MLNIIILYRIAEANQALMDVIGKRADINSSPWSIISLQPFHYMTLQ